MRVTVESTVSEPEYAMLAASEAGHDHQTATEALDLCRSALVAYGFQVSSVDGAVVSASAEIEGRDAKKEMEGE